MAAEIYFFNRELVDRGRVSLALTPLAKHRMLNKNPGEMPNATTPYQIAVLILLWLFILLWISPLATFGRTLEPSEPNLAPTPVAAAGVGLR